MHLFCMCLGCAMGGRRIRGHGGGSEKLKPITSNGIAALHMITSAVV